MATPIFQKQVEAFLRRVGEGNISISYTSHVPNNTLSRYTFPIIYDYFWLTGKALLRVIDRISQGDLYEIVPTFVKSVAASSLTASALTVPSDFWRLIGDAYVAKGAGSYVRSKVINPSRLFETLYAEGNYALTSDEPRHHISGTTLTVYPTAYGYDKISYRYVANVTRITLADDSSSNDIWDDSLSDLLIEGAVMYSRGDANDVAMEDYFSKKLGAKVAIFQQPKTEQDNSAIITDVK